MKKFTLLLLFVTLFTAIASAQSSSDGWISLFDGESFDGWKAAENPETFSIEDGKIVAHGPRAHLFYMGPVENHNFDDFEFKVDVMTTPGSNSGIFFHTKYQEEGWPAQGYECQVNNSYDQDPIRTASIYGVANNSEPPAPDNQWFTMTIRVEGQHITISVDDKTITNYTEPDDVDRGTNVLSSGTFALQGHDPDSKVYFKNIRVKPL